MSQSPVKNKRYCYLLNDAVKFAWAYEGEEGARASSIKHLYTTLVTYCNSIHWEMPFPMSDNQLSLLTSMKRGTIIKAREALIKLEKIKVERKNGLTYYTFFNQSQTPPDSDKPTKDKEGDNPPREGGAKTGVICDDFSPISDSIAEPNDEKNSADYSNLDQKTLPNGDQKGQLYPPPQNMENEATSEKSKVIPHPSLATTTPTTTPTNYPTIYQSINCEQDHQSEKSAAKQTEEAVGKNGSIDRLSKKKGKNLGHGEETFASLVAEFGPEVVNQARRQVLAHQQRTGQTHLIFSYRYMRKACLNVLGMKESEDFVNPPRHDHEPFFDQLEDPFDSTHTAVGNYLADHHSDLITNRFGIFSDEFPKIYDERATIPLLVNRMIPVLEKYRKLGYVDSNYYADKEKGVLKL